MILKDASRFWQPALARGLLMLLGGAIVVALAATNAGLLHSSLWFTPAGTSPSGPLATLGQYGADGAFAPVALKDIEKLEAAGFPGRYGTYSLQRADLRIGGVEIAQAEIGVVSPDLFSLLDVRLESGQPVPADFSGALLGPALRDRLGPDWTAEGKAVQIGALTLPVSGAVAPAFVGLGDAQPEIWVPARHISKLLEIGLPLPPARLEAASEELARELPLFHALVLLDGDRDALSRWSVRDNAEIAIDGGRMRLGFDARGAKPAVLEGIDLTPGRTRTVVSYLGLLGTLNAALALLVMITVASFFAFRASLRGRELKTRTALGATPLQLARMFASEQLPFFVAMAVLAAVFHLIAMRWVGTLPSFDDYLATRRADRHLISLLPSLVILGCLAAIGFFAQWSAFRNGSLRSNALGALPAAGLLNRITSLLLWLLVGGVTMVAGGSALSGYKLSTAEWGGAADPWLVSVSTPMFPAGAAHELRIEPHAWGVVEVAPLQPLQDQDMAYLVGGTSSARQRLFFNSYAGAALELLGIPLLAGNKPDAGNEAQVLASRAVAERFGLTPASLVGRTLVRINAMQPGQDETLRVAGVVGDVHYRDLRASPEPVIYHSLHRSAAEGVLVLARPSGQDHPRTEHAGTQLSTSMKYATMPADLAARNRRSEVALSIATAGLGVLALVLIWMGVLMRSRAQLVQRRRELALQLALGALPSQVTWQFIRNPAAIAAVSSGLMLAILALCQPYLQSRFPLLTAGDLAWLAVLMLCTGSGFVIALAVTAASHLRGTDLSALLREER